MLNRWALLLTRDESCCKRQDTFSLELLVHSTLYLITASFEIRWCTGFQLTFKVADVAPPNRVQSPTPFLHAGTSYRADMLQGHVPRSERSERRRHPFVISSALSQTDDAKSTSIR
jgi:hypothetical protein